MSRAPNINRSRIHEKMVQRLAVDPLPELGKRLFPTIREFLCFSALLGYSEGRRIPLDRSEGIEDVSYQQFERNEAVEIVYAIAIAEEKSSDILKEDRESDCAQIFEEYANGGMILIDEWLSASADLAPDKAIFAGLLQAGFITVDGDEDIEGKIAGISF